MWENPGKIRSIHQKYLSMLERYLSPHKRDRDSRIRSALSAMDNASRFYMLHRKRVELEQR